MNNYLNQINQSHIQGGYGVYTAWVMLSRSEQNDVIKPKSIVKPLGNNIIALYPNPANGSVFISSTQLLDNAKVDLFSINGTLVYSCNVSANSGYSFQLNIAMLKAGIYYCRVTTLEGKQMNSKLVVY